MAANDFPWCRRQARRDSRADLLCSPSRFGPLDPDEAAAFRYDRAFTLTVLPRRPSDANDSTHFDHPVQFEATIVEPDHLIHVLDGRGATHQQARHARN